MAPLNHRVDGNFSANSRERWYVMKYGNVTMGQVEAAINILGGEENFLRLLRGELVVKTAQFRLTPTFDYNKTKDGWTLVSDSEDKEGDFEPELMEFLREGESSIIGEEMLKRTEKEGFGQRHAEAMLRNQNAIPVEWRKYVLVFTGTLWRGLSGNRYVPHLYWSGSGWYLHFRWLGYGFVSYSRVVRPRK